MSKGKPTPEVIVATTQLLQSGAITNDTLQAYIDAVYGTLNDTVIPGPFTRSSYNTARTCKCPTCLPTDRDYGKRPPIEFTDGEVIDGVAIRVA